jgi:hypothetical protein
MYKDVWMTTSLQVPSKEIGVLQDLVEVKQTKNYYNYLLVNHQLHHKVEQIVFSDSQENVKKPY